MRSSPDLIPRRLTALAVIGFLVLGGRYLWITLNEPGGAAYIAHEIRSAVAVSPSYIAERPRHERAAFWLAEAERLAKRYPDDAELLAGAAILLNEQSKHLGDYYYSPRRAPMIAEPEVFQQCERASLRLAKAASVADPGNPRWTRLIASVSWPPMPRRISRETQQEVLKELARCQHAEPANALYDYLSAALVWRGVRTVNPRTHQVTFNERDPAFRHGLVLLRRGQAKPIFSSDVTGLPCLAKFVRASSAAPLDQLVAMEHATEAAQTHQPAIMFIALMLELTTHADFGGRPSVALSRFDAWSQAYRQFQCPSHPSLDAIFEKELATWINNFALMNPRLLDGEDRRCFRHAAVLATMQWEIHTKSHRDSVKRIHRLRANSATGRQPEYALLSLMLRHLPKLILLLLSGGLLAAYLTRGRRDSELGVDAISVMFFFILIAALLILTLMLFPTNVVPHWLQHWFFTLFAITLPIAIPLGAAFYTRSRVGHFSIATIMGITVLTAIVLTLAINLEKPSSWNFRTFPFEITTPEIKLDRRSTWALHYGPIGSLFGNAWDARAATHWDRYFVPFWIVLASLGAILTLASLKIRRHAARESRVPLSEQWSTMLQTLRCGCLTIGLALLAFYLAAAPNAIRTRAATFEETMAAYEAHDALLAEFSARVEAFESNYTRRALAMSDALYWLRERETNYVTLRRSALWAAGRKP